MTTVTSTATDRKIDQPKAGDQVRLVIEGRWKYGDGYHFTGGGFSDDEVISLEVLKRHVPKPGWWPPQAGDVLGWGRFAWLRKDGDDGQWEAAPGGSIDDARVLELVGDGDARLLVRAGHPVS